MSETYHIIIKGPGTYTPLPYALDPNAFLIVVQDETAITTKPYNFKPILDFARIIVKHNHENRTQIDN